MSKQIECLQRRTMAVEDKTRVKRVASRASGTERDLRLNSHEALASAAIYPLPASLGLAATSHSTLINYISTTDG